jgi:hypothetical protein
MTERLRSAYEIAWLLRQVESPETVVGWFIGVNPELDDRPPALEIADRPAAVMQAARAFLVNG